MSSNMYPFKLTILDMFFSSPRVPGIEYSYYVKIMQNSNRQNQKISTFFHQIISQLLVRVEWAVWWFYEFRWHTRWLYNDYVWLCKMMKLWQNHVLDPILKLRSPNLTQRLIYWMIHSSFWRFITMTMILVTKHLYTIYMVYN